MFSVSIACSMQEKMPIDWKSADGSVLAMSTVILARGKWIYYTSQITRGGVISVL